MTFKLLLSTAVWGEDYLEIFLEYTLKSLLTDSNLLNKKISKKSEYLIYAESNHIDLIKNHINFKKLKKKIRIKILNIKKKNKEKYISLKYFQNLSIQYGYKNKFNYFIFIYPDSIFGENHFQSLFSKINKGYKIIMCPGPLGIYEKFFITFKKKKINNINLSKFIIHNLHPFYKTFLNKDINNRIEILENKEKTYQIYKCLDLHPAIISLSIQNLEVENTYDEDILKNKNINLSDIGYLNNSNEGIIITLESFDTERGIVSNNLKFHDLKTVSQHIYDLIKYCDIKNSYLNISHSLKGIFFLSTKDKKKELSSLNIHNEKIRMFKNIMKNNNFKFNKKENIIDQFLNFKKNNSEIKNIYLNNFENGLNSMLKSEAKIKEKLHKKELKEMMKLKELEDKLQERERILEIKKLKNQKIKEERKQKIQKIKEERNQKIQEERIRIRSKELELLRAKFEERKKEAKYVNVIVNENVVKLSLLSFLIFLFKVFPDFIKKPFIKIKQKNKSNKFINKNINLIRFLLMLPNKTMFKILIKRII